MIGVSLMGMEYLKMVSRQSTCPDLTNLPSLVTGFHSSPLLVNLGPYFSGIDLLGLLSCHPCLFRILFLLLLVLLVDLLVDLLVLVVELP